LEIIATDFTHTKGDGLRTSKKGEAIVRGHKSTKKNHPNTPPPPPTPQGVVGKTT